MAEHKEEKQGSVPNKEKPTTRRPSLKRLLVSAVLAIVVIFGLGFASIYAVSPAPIRHPKMEHFHFRMQVSVDGKDVDFSQPDFQTPYAKDQCTADLSAEPFHFHDKRGQFVHVHWADLTGGLMLKNYGWNFVGGKTNLLGYRLDNLPRAKGVPIHGDVLPKVPDGTKFWVYTGDEHGYQKKSLDDFKSQKLEQFFGKDSNFPKSALGNVVDWFFPRASAHGDEADAVVLSVGDETEQERLTRINNLLGNVVIFVQKDEPSDAQIKAKFAILEPLSDSTCGG